MIKNLFVCTLALIGVDLAKILLAKRPPQLAEIWTPGAMFPPPPDNLRG